MPTDILKLFDDSNYLKISAPMVRYSKLQFRSLVRQYGCDLCFTPMILADSFCQSAKARNNEFTTNLCDSPLVVQFASNTVHDFVGAADMVSPYCDGVDLNCGCPQLWARQQNLGCVLLENPELISDLVKQCRNQISKPFTVSVKMRISKNLSKTVNICRQLEKAGVSFLTIHARTQYQSTGDIDETSLKLCSETVSCPVIANGNLKTIDDCDYLHSKTSCKGFMIANALLTNPTLFAGTNKTTLQCVQEWVDTCYNSTLNMELFEMLNEGSDCTRTIPERPPNLTFQCFHHHLVFMLEKILTRKERQVFNNLQKFKEVLEFLDLKFSIVPKLFRRQKFLQMCCLNLDYSDRDSVYQFLKEQNNCNEVQSKNLPYNYSDTEGQFFKKKLRNDSDEVEYDLSGFFDGG